MSLTAEANNTSQDLNTLRTIILGNEVCDRNELDQFRSEILRRLDSIEQKIVEKNNFGSHLVKSKDHVVDIVSPNLGLIIRKSVAAQIEKLNNRFSSPSFSIKSLFSRKNSLEYEHPEIVQIFIIDKNSGLLIGQYERRTLAEVDMMAGMLTAIKSFAETALSKNTSEVNLIEYGDYSIRITNYGTFYLSVIFEGFNNPIFDEFLSDEIDNFCKHHIEQLSLTSNQERSKLENESIINPYFDKTCQNLQEKLS